MGKIRIKVQELAKKSPRFKKVVKVGVNIKKNILYKIYQKKYEVEENVVLFESFMGRKYSDNPKAIYLEMLKDEKYKNFKFVWAFKKPEKKKDILDLKNAILIKTNTKQYLKYCSKAKYIITNSILPEFMTFKKSQIYVQCWHGTPLKRLGYDIVIEGGNALNTLKDMEKRYKIDAKRQNYLVSPSKFTTEKLSSAFNLKENNPNVEIIEEGYPRNDFLSNYTEADSVKIKKILGIENETRKIVLYAPTWRDNQHTSGVGYTYEIGASFDKLQEKLGEDFIILFRPHYLVANKFDFEKYKGFVIDVTEHEDINELYVIADMLVTDYSSVFFDYAKLQRPIVFFMYDLEDYKDNIRGFYLDIKELPGNIFETEEGLIEELYIVKEKFELDQRYLNFCQKYTYLDKGVSCKKLLEKVF